MKCIVENDVGFGLKREEEDLRSSVSPQLLNVDLYFNTSKLPIYSKIVFGEQETAKARGYTILVVLKWTIKGVAGRLLGVHL